MSKPLSLFASCQPGLEPLLHQELAELGHDPTAVAGGVEFVGDKAAVRRACLWLGTASHVRVRLAQFRCRALGELHRKAQELPWRDWLVRRAPLQLQAKARRSRVYHTGGIRERVFLAIADALGAQPPLIDTADAGDAQLIRFATLHVRFDEDVCTISLDATATPLHRRGYRLDGRKAPLREDLAHALVLSSGHGEGEALLDPFCGSGTIAIEAALRALRLPPGRLRPAPFGATAHEDDAAWTTMCDDAIAAAATTTAPIAASDRDRGAIAATRANAERAGVLQHLSIGEHAIKAQPWFCDGAEGVPERGVVASNPPFGRRVKGKGSDNSLAPLYQTLGNRITALGDGWRAAILAHDLRLCRRTGLDLKAAFTTKHGGLSVTALTTKTPTEGAG